MRCRPFDVLVKPLGLDKPQVVLDKEPSVEETLENAVQRALGWVYMADVGKAGNPPAVNHWWLRRDVQLDGRIAQVLEQNGFVEGRNKIAGIPAEVRLTREGVAVARRAIEGIRS
jgi:hypothetical protein